MLSLPDAIEKVLAFSHIPMVHDVFGDEGLDAIYAVIRVVKALYQHVDPERIEGNVVVYKRVGSDPSNQMSRTTCHFPSLANSSIENLVIEVGLQDVAYVCPVEDLNVDELAETSIVYLYRSSNEEFLAGDARREVMRLDSSAPSQFAVPTIRDLREALRQYSIESVQESTCKLFDQVWFDQRRCFLKARPEATMRNSLVQFLRNRLGGAHDVFPEQNVNETNPVDIRVEPRFANNRLMLIEIKWLGNSADEEGHVTTKYRDARANEGAEQLVGYLEEQRRSAPTRLIHGYYVVIDARRRSLPTIAERTVSISNSDGMYYESKEITFVPDYSQRPDFDPPLRMFARPLCG